jgi:hypothetical protein
LQKKFSFDTNVPVLFWFRIPTERLLFSMICLPPFGRVNDRVLVEASYNANMPFKWNATRVQVLPGQTGPLIGQVPVHETRHFCVYFVIQSPNCRTISGPGQPWTRTTLETI